MIGGIFRSLFGRKPPPEPASWRESVAEAEPPAPEPELVVPGPVIEAPAVPVTLEATAPDPAAAEAAALPSITAVLEDFETLGDNPEMGLLRDRLGAGPDGLFGLSTMTPQALLILLRTRFDGFCEPATLKAKQDWGFYYTVETQQNLVWRSPIRVEQMSEADALQSEAQRLGALRTRLIAGLESGSRLFVYAGTLTGQEREAIRAAMAAYGTNTLLHVMLADEAHPARHVAWLEPGLLGGYLSHYGNQPGGWTIAVDDWVTVCRTAHGLWRAVHPRGV